MAVLETAPERRAEFLALIGDPAQAIAELLQAQESGRVLSSDHRRLISQYLKKWIALHAGDVVASADTLEELLDHLDSETRRHSLVRFIDHDELKLIL